MAPATRASSRCCECWCRAARTTDVAEPRGALQSTAPMAAVSEGLLLYVLIASPNAFIRPNHRGSKPSSWNVVCQNFGCYNARKEQSEHPMYCAATCAPGGFDGVLIISSLTRTGPAIAATSVSTWAATMPVVRRSTVAPSMRREGMLRFVCIIESQMVQHRPSRPSPAAWITFGLTDDVTFASILDEPFSVAVY